MPDIKACVKSFSVLPAATTGTVTGIVDRDGAAFVPKVGIIFGNVEGFLDTSTMVVFDSLGFDDSSNHFGTSYGWFWFDAIPWTGYGSSVTKSLLQNIFRFSPAFTLAGQITSFASGSFTYSLTTNTISSAVTFSILLLGGDDLSVKIGKLPNSSVGVHSVTGVGFEPKGAICFNQSTAGTAGITDNIINIGFCGTDLAQYANCTVLGEVGAPANANKYQIADVIAVSVHPSTGIASDLVRMISWDADGFTYEILSSATGIITDITYLLLGIDDADTTVEVGTFLQKTTNGSQQVSIANNTPIFMLCASVGGASSAAIQNDCAWSLGAFDGTRARSTWHSGLDGSTASGDGGAVYGSDDLLFFGTPDGLLSSDAIVTGKLEGVNFNANGFRGNWTEVDGLAREILYISLGIPVVVSPLSGIYKLQPGKTNDTLYTGFDPVTTEDRKIP